MTDVQMLVVALAFLLAGFSKGAIGMGLPPIAIGLMTFVMPLSDALAIMVLPSITTNIWQALYGGHFRSMLKRFWSLGVAAVAGVFAVAWTFGNLGSGNAIAWLGVVLVIYSTIALFAWRAHVRSVTEPWANPLIGFFSGVVGGFTGIAAVPFLPYMQSLELRKDELVQALGILFIFIIGAIAVALARQGAFDTTNAVGGLAANVPAFIGIWLGQKARHAASPETFRRIFLAGMLGIGVHMARGLL